MNRISKLERDAIRRKKIVLATMDCVTNHGFHKTSISMISSKIALSEG